MAVAEIQGRLNVVCQDLLTFFTEAGIERHSITLLNEKLDSHDTVEFLTICEAYGRCMAFINHDLLHTKLVQGLSLLDDGVGAERKVLIKRIRNLEGDKNADAAHLAKLHGAKVEIDQKKVRTLINCLKYKYMTTLPFEKFKDENAKKLFDENKVVGLTAGKHTVGRQKH